MERGKSEGEAVAIVGEESSRSCNDIGGDGSRVPAITKTARKAIGTTTACLYTGRIPTLAKFITTTAGT